MLIIQLSTEELLFITVCLFIYSYTYNFFQQLLSSSLQQIHNLKTMFQ